MGLAIGGVGPRVDGHGPPSRLVRAADGDLDPDSVVFGEDQRRLERQVRQPGAADAVPGLERQFQEAACPGRGPCRPTAWSAQPRVGPEGQPAGEQGSAAFRQRDHGAEQRVSGGGEPEPGRVTGRGARDAQPVALPLEGVRRQVDSACAAARRRRPASAVRCRGRAAGHGGQECREFVAVLAQRGHEERLLGVVGAAPRPGPAR